MERKTNVPELITFGLSQEVKPEHVQLLKKVLSDNEYKQTTQAALVFLQDGIVIDGLPLDARMFWGKVALYLDDAVDSTIQDETSQMEKIVDKSADK